MFIKRVLAGLAATALLGTGAVALSTTAQASGFGPATTAVGTQGQDRLRDGTCDNTATPIGDQVPDRLRDGSGDGTCDGTCDGTPDQVRKHAHDSTGTQGGAGKAYRAGR